MTRSILVALVVLAAALGIPGAALAAPANDDFANAITIDPSSLPFADSVSIDDATLESGEPNCYLAGKSVWYKITPTAGGVLRADVGGSSFFDRFVYVYHQAGSGFGGLSTVACASPYFNGRSDATFQVQAGETYYVQAGGVFSSSTGTLDLTVDAVPPPPNDDFANAKTVASLPSSDTVDTTGATTEAGEPFPCGSTGGTVWYAFTPSSSGSVTATASGQFTARLAAYTGGSLASLTSMGCKFYNLTIHVDAGTTYYFQVGDAFGGGGQIQFQLAQAPPPQASFVSYPGDPSTLDNVQFIDTSYDPAQAGISSEQWDFGDGAAAGGCCPTHKYNSDGDYTVQLAITTTDGRTASTSQTIQVRTHDVTIAKFLVPQSASAGQTRTITVGVTNSRYPENVDVDLYRSVPGGDFVQVGSLTQSVPVRGANRTTNFGIGYTFTQDDAAAGKVTFKAVATIVGHHDALPADNTAIALPTKVNG
jgi:PKD domain